MPRYSAMMKGLEHYVELVADEEIRGRFFITGFHGVGHVGWIAVRHMVTQLGAERVGYLVTRHMQPFVSVKDGIVLPYEIYRHRDAVFLLTNIPFSERDSSIVPLFVAEKFHKSFEEAILIGGLDSRRKEGDESPLKLAPTSIYLARHSDTVNKYGLLGEGLGIVGPLAYMLSVFEARKFPAVAILPYAAVERPDPTAAAKAVEAVGEFTGLEIDVKELVEEGIRVEQKVEELEKKIREAMRERETPPYYI